MLRAHSILLLTLPMLVSACTEQLHSLDEVTETTVDTRGAMISSAAGELTLEFSSGVLAASSVVRIQTDRSVTLDGLASPVFDLSIVPSVQTFDPPVVLRLQANANGKALVIANLDGETPQWVQGSTHDLATGVVTAPLTHFSRYAAMVAPNPVCPSTEPSGTCSDEGLRCEYGQECCCGECHPSLVYNCNGGLWAGHYTDACLGASLCMDAGTPTCPASPPSGACQDEGLTCEYGEECCCGQCYPSLVYSCNGGLWAGHNTDACFRPACPDAGHAD